jgi:hypothetical protein
VTRQHSLVDSHFGEGNVDDIGDGESSLLQLQHFRALTSSTAAVFELDNCAVAREQLQQSASASSLRGIFSFNVSNSTACICSSGLTFSVRDMCRCGSVQLQRRAAFSFQQRQRQRQRQRCEQMQQHQSPISDSDSDSAARAYSAFSFSDFAAANTIIQRDATCAFRQHLDDTRHAPFGSTLMTRDMRLSAAP